MEPRVSNQFLTSKAMMVLVSWILYQKRLTHKVWVYILQRAPSLMGNKYMQHTIKLLFPSILLFPSKHWIKWVIFWHFMQHIAITFIFAFHFNNTQTCMKCTLHNSYISWSSSKQKVFLHPLTNTTVSIQSISPLLSNVDYKRHKSRSHVNCSIFKKPNL